jgi:nucleotide-binding universal stress UspA family protein
MEQNQEVVVSCIDGSSVSEYVCDYGAWIAKTVNAPLKILHTIEHRVTPSVIDYSGAIGLGSREELLTELTEIEQARSKLLIKQGQLMLNHAKAQVEAAGIDDAELCQRHGSLVESLIELEDKIRVLVIGIRGESHEDDQVNGESQGIGTQLESIIRSLSKPILVVNKPFTEPKTIMLAYDGSEACKKALDMLASSPLFKNIECHIVHVGEDKNLLDDAAKVLKGEGIQTITAMLEGKIEEALAVYQESNNIDLMLMGAFTHNRFRDFLVGSFTAKMLDKTQQPLLLLRRS